MRRSQVPAATHAAAGHAAWFLIGTLVVILAAVGAWIALRNSQPVAREDASVTKPPRTDPQRATPKAAAPIDPALQARQRTAALLAAAQSLQRSDPRQALRFVSAARGQPAAPIDSEAVRDALNAAHVMSDGRVLTAGRDHDAVLWNADGSEAARFHAHRGPVLDVSLSPSGEQVLTASSDGTARIWSVSGQPLVVLSGHAGAVRSARFDAHGQRILTVGLDGTARLWSGSGQAGPLLPSAGAAMVEAHFLAGGALVLTRDDRGTARLFDDTGAELEGRIPRVTVAALRRTGGPAATVALAPAHDGSVLRIDTAAQTALLLRGHAARVLDATVSPNADLAATASLDGTARVWSADGRALRVLEGHGLAVVAVRLDSDGKRVLTLGADGHARLFDEHGTSLVQLAGPAFAELGFAAGGSVIWAVPRDGSGLLLFDEAGRSRPDGLHLDGAPQRNEAELDIGTAGCADCHRKEYDLWAGSNHARTMEPAVASNVPAIVRAGGTAAHPPGATTFRTGDAGYLARTIGADGAPHDYPLGWVAGRRRIRMYVTDMPDGRLQVLPAMRAELPDEWFDYTHLLFGGDPTAVPIVKPGDDAFWTGAGRSWGARCARCHSSGVEPRAVAAGRGGPRATWRDLAVDCEACHGPGRAHAEAWARADTNAPLLKLGTLGRQASIDACTSCHMEGEVVGTKYRLGEDLYEFLDPTLLLDTERIDSRGRPLELIYHGVSFAVSRCAKEGKLTCVRCHDAHGGPHPALLGKPPTNHELCAECHVDLVRDVAGHGHHDATGSGGSCIACHMPRLVIERGHGIITDHSIGVPDPTAAGPGMARDACSWCHQGGLGAPAGVVQLSAEKIRDAYAKWWPEATPARPWMEAVAAGRNSVADGDADADAALVEILQDRDQYRVVRATAAGLLGRVPDRNAAALLRAASDVDSLVRRNALRSLAGLRSAAADTALLEALKDPSPAVRFAAARTALVGWQRVQDNADLLAAILPALAEEAAAVPNDEMRWFRLGAARDVAGDVPGAIEAYAAMVALHPLAHNVKQRLEQLRKEDR